MRSRYRHRLWQLRRGGVCALPLHVGPPKPGLVVGAGSNVIDLYYPLRQFPTQGEKQYFALEQVCSATHVGGVTLNHLCWARALGCQTGLMALHGPGEDGKQIRDKLEEIGVDTTAVKVSGEYSTSVSHVFTSPDGERTILMAPASTSRLTQKVMEQQFAGTIWKAAMVTTEISQLPLAGVLYLLRWAARARIPSLLDIDVTPEVALGAARLGSKEELIDCITSASVVKVTATAADEVYHLVTTSALDASLDGKAKQLAEALKADLCVVTAGSRGAALAPGGRSTIEPVVVPIFPNISQVDATGAGDAFFGAVVAWTYANGLPPTAEGLRVLGKVASAAGAACVEVEGALPVPHSSIARVLQLAPEAQSLVDAAAALDRARALSSRRHEWVPAVRAFVESLSADATVMSELAPDAVGGKLGDAEEAIKLLAAASSSAPSCARHVYTTGIGKSGFVAARMASSLRSIGMAASYVPGAEWVHGDLGTFGQSDVLVAMSHSGTTVELLDVVKRLRQKGGHVIAITGSAASPLAKVADVHLHAQVREGSEFLGKVPTRSIMAQEAIVNALLQATACATGFMLRDFAASHPGGAIGQSALDVS